MLNFLLKYETFTATVIGALLASILGLLSHFFLSWRTSCKESLYAFRIIFSELSRARTRIYSLRNDPNPEIKGKIPIFKLLPTNSFFIYRKILEKHLPADRFNFLESFYSTLSEWDYQIDSIRQGRGSPEMIWEFIESDNTGTLLYNAQIMEKDLYYRGMHWIQKIKIKVAVLINRLLYKLNKISKAV